MHYKLLTPGPLTTSEQVKASMMKDWCTWDDDYKTVVQDIRSRLLTLFQASPAHYTTVLMQGSGSFAVEATLGTALTKGDHLLVIANGAYGQRMADMAKTIGKKITLLNVPETQIIQPELLEQTLIKESSITHVAFVHCETTTGILNPLSELAEVVKRYQKKLIIDAMSSLGGVPIDIEACNIDFIISSANKCVQGVPGFGFVIAKTHELAKCQGYSHSISLDLYDQWYQMEQDPGKWRFTSPTHVVRAFQQALIELDEEGLIHRFARYAENQKVLVEGMESLGFTCCIDAKYQSPIITTFFYPELEGFTFQKLYDALKKSHFVIYPGKLSNLQVFRIGNIGEIYPEDMSALIRAIEIFIKELS